MSYQYVTEKRSYEDYAAGRVLLHRPGATAFPVRLASEVFQRCVAALRQQGNDGPYHVYDPCCGTGYLLTTLGLLHGDQVRAFTASDIDPESVEVAGRNLALLSPTGLDERAAQLQTFVEQYGKDSHRQALTSVDRLREQLGGRTIPASAAVADATQSTDGAQAIDLLITDVPYGQSSHWRTDDSDSIGQLLTAQPPVLNSPAVVAIISDKGQRADHPAYQRLQRFSIGKRRVTILIYPKN